MGLADDISARLDQLTQASMTGFRTPQEAVGFALQAIGQLGQELVTLAREVDRLRDGDPTT
jgi:hypothetical protein